MRTVLQIVMFVLAVLDLAMGVLAGSVALASLITEYAARAVAAITRGISRRTGAQPAVARLAKDLAGVLNTSAAGGTR